MKNKINGKTITIIILIILVIILLMINIFLFFNNNDVNNKNTNNENNNVTGENGEEKQAEDFITAFYNNFLLTYIIEGDIKTGSGTLKSSEDNEIYYAVTDYLLEDIHSLEDINRLVDDYVEPYSALRVKKVMESSYANQYKVYNNQLYVKKSTNPCFRLEEKIDLSHATYEHRSQADVVIYERVPYTFTIGEDGKPKSPVLLFTCIRNFGSIGTGKEDVFEPSAEDLLTPSDFEHDE